MMTGLLRAALAVALTIALGAQASAQRRPKDNSNLGVREKLVIAKAVAALLLDGKTAKFRFLPFSSRKGEGSRPYCALVNARNAMGQYAGFRPFLAYLTLARGQVGQAQIYGIANKDPANPVTAEVQRRCSRAGYKIPPG